MDFDEKARSVWGMNQTFADESGSAVEYLRALRRSNQGVSPDPGLPDEDEVLSRSERRRHARYQCEGSAELSSDNGSIRTWGNITDLSRAGCYLELQGTIPVDTVLDMIIEVRGVKFCARGIVRASYPSLGIGLEFTQLAASDQARLNQLLLLLVSSAWAPAQIVTPCAAPLPDISQIQDPLAALYALAAHFRGSETLTRKEFVEFIARTRPRTTHR